MKTTWLILMALAATIAISGCFSQDEPSTLIPGPTEVPISDIIGLEVTPRDSAINEGDELQALILGFLKMNSRGGNR
ncbi:MAG: hypothetical protein IH860_05205 [Chloroflexi bacterium]|nr:hypothetical protein [Chloroflexota bacterium]